MKIKNLIRSRPLWLDGMIFHLYGIHQFNCLLQRQRPFTQSRLKVQWQLKYKHTSRLFYFKCRKCCAFIQKIIHIKGSDTFLVENFFCPSKFIAFLLTVLCHIFALILQQRGWRQHIAALQSLSICASVQANVTPKEGRANIDFRQVNATTGSYFLKIAMHLTLRQYALGCTDFCLLLAGNTMWVQGKKITTALFRNRVAWCCSG